MSRDSANAKLRPSFNSEELLLSSTKAPWRDVIKLEHHRSLTLENTEHCPCEHVVTMYRAPTVHLEWWLAGKKQPDLLLRSGMIGFIPAGVPIRGRGDRERELSTVAIDQEFVSKVAQDFCRSDRMEFRNGAGIKDFQIEHLILSLESELKEGCLAGRLYGESVATALAVRLVQRYSVFAQKAAEYRGGLSPAQIHLVIDYVEAHLDADISICQLADLVHMSPSRFAHLFKQSTGLPPHQYFLRQRITKAKELLTDNRLSLAEISYILGFPSQSHFTTIFQKRVGATPGVYRRECGRSRILR